MRTGDSRTIDRKANMFDENIILIYNELNIDRKHFCLQYAGTEREVMLKKAFSPKVKSALFALLVLAAVSYSLLFTGITDLTPAALQRLGRIKTCMDLMIYALAFLCALLEASQSWPRALLSLLLLALRWRSPLSWQQGMLLDTALLALLSDLGTEKSNGSAFLAAHILYLPILFALLHWGWTKELLMKGRKGFWIFQTGHSYGMSHPNNFAAFFMSTWMVLWLLYVPKRGWIAFLFFWTGAFAMYAMTLCRTVAVLMVGFPILYIVQEAIRRSRHPALLQAAAAAPPLMAAMTVILGSQTSYRSGKLLDDAFWLRFNAFSVLWEDGLTLFGSITSPKSYFDNLYLWLPMYCGLIPTLGVLAAYICMLYRLAREKRTALLATALLFVLYGVMENTAVYAAYCFVAVMAFARPDNVEKEGLPS